MKNLRSLIVASYFDDDDAEGNGRVLKGPESRASIIADIRLNRGRHPCRR